MSHSKDDQPAAQARREDLVIQELQDEVLVYDLKSHKAHCLNQTAAFVWNHCNGRTTAAELAVAMEREWGKPITEDFVWLALKQLSKSGLLERKVTRPNGEMNMSRRAALRLGLATAVAPLVTSIVAPTAAAGASVPVVCQTCIKKTVGLNNCGICANVCGQCYDNSGCGNGQELGCQTCAACDAQLHGVNSTYSWEAPNGCAAPCPGLPTPTP